MSDTLEATKRELEGAGIAYTCAGIDLNHFTSSEMDNILLHTRRK